MDASPIVVKVKEFLFLSTPYNFLIVGGTGFFHMMGRVKIERCIREKFRKRRANLFKKASELASMTESKVLIIVQHDGKFHTYKSTEDPHWLPRSEDVSDRYQQPRTTVKRP